MKKLLTLLALIVFYPSLVVGSGRAPASSSGAHPEEVPSGKTFFKKDDRLQLSAYKDQVCLVCTGSSNPRGFWEINWKIEGEGDHHIPKGEILLQYYPKGANELGFPQDVPLIRVRYIEVASHYQRKHVASHALETLWAGLRQRFNCPSSTQVGLEYPLELASWYQKFGFHELKGVSAPGTKLATVLLRDTQFPYVPKPVKKEGAS